MKEKKRIINIDESWISETGFIRKVWAKKDGRGNINLSAVTPRLSMIAALDTEGRVWFSLAHATTNSDVIALFMKNLMNSLDQESPGWQENTVFLFDNATYHKSVETVRFFSRWGLQVIFSGPYSYSAAPTETLFSGLKYGELNTDNLPTGKR